MRKTSNFVTEQVIILIPYAWCYLNDKLKLYSYFVVVTLIRVFKLWIFLIAVKLIGSSWPSGILMFKLHAQCKVKLPLCFSFVMLSHFPTTTACALTWLEHIASQALHEFSWPGWWCRLSHLSFESKGEFKAKPAGSVWPCESDKHTRSTFRNSLLYTCTCVNKNAY